MNKTKRNIYYHRLSGIINSILGKNLGTDQQSIDLSKLYIY